MFNADEFILGLGGADQFIQLRLDSSPIPVLSVLNNGSSWNRVGGFCAEGLTKPGIS
jgi:hypothetical protein